MLKKLLLSLVLMFSLSVQSKELISFMDAYFDELESASKYMSQNATLEESYNFFKLIGKVTDLYSKKITAKQFEDSLTETDAKILEKLANQGYSGHSYLLANHYLVEEIRERERIKENKTQNKQENIFLEKSVNLHYKLCASDYIKESCYFLSILEKSKK